MTRLTRDRKDFNIVFIVLAPEERYVCRRPYVKNFFPELQRSGMFKAVPANMSSLRDFREKSGFHPTHMSPLRGYSRFDDYTNPHVIADMV
jgi:hypothetical protein